MVHYVHTMICDIMSDEAKDHVVDNLVGCTLSITAFNMVTDLNRKLAFLQQMNKEYNALAHKLEDESISLNDLDAAAPVAKIIFEALTSSVSPSLAFRVTVRSPLKRAAPL